MATTTSKNLFRGSANVSTTLLYTVPANTTTVVTNIAVCNTAASSATFSFLLNGVSLHSGTTIAANTTVYIDLKQVMNAAQQIQGAASAATVSFHIAGVEIA
jgi:hypothetical protein